MEDGTIYESLVRIVKSYRETISKINTGILDTGAFAAVQTISNIMADSPISQAKQNLHNTANTIANLSRTYSNVLHIDTQELTETMRKTINVLQAATGERLCYSYSTDMINNLRESFAAAKYEAFPQIINDTIKKPIVEAADIAFLKTPGVLRTFEEQIILPRGMKSSIDALHINTSEGISKTGEIKYDTVTNEFVSTDSRLKSAEMNVVYSAKKLFRDKDDDEMFSETELMDFQSFLSSRLTMAMKNPVGIRIHDFLTTMFKNKRNTINFDCNLYYHSRNLKEKNAPYTIDEMMRAPYGLSGPGRYNHPGRSHYYFADKQSGAENEMKKYRKKDEITQTIKLVPIKDIKLLDLSGSIRGIETFLKYIRYPISNMDSKTPREYLIPSFVADCCKDIGFEGIKYFGSNEYNNYVTWNDGYFRDGGMCNLLYSVE